jgi:NAD(P)H-dependent FMN reductase
MRDLLIVGTSLDPDSRSQHLARIAFEDAKTLGMNPELIDLRALELPMAGLEGSWNDPRVDALKTRVKNFSRVLFCVPIYNYDVNAAAKNFIELVGGALQGAVVGFACTAGGRSSYMSVMGFANALQLDFRAWIVPRFVYAIDNEWNGDDPGEKIHQRIHGVLESLRDGPMRTDERG